MRRNKKQKKYTDLRIVEIMKREMPPIYYEVDPEKKLTDKQALNMINYIIKESREHHPCDMSGLVDAIKVIENGCYQEDIKRLRVVRFYNIYFESKNKYDTLIRRLLC